MNASFLLNDEQLAGLCPQCSKIILLALSRGNGESAFHTHIAPSHTGKPGAPTLGELADKFYLNKVNSNLNQNYVRQTRNYVTKFIKGREDLPADGITVEDIETWFDCRGEKPCTRAGNLGRLSAFFGFGWRRGFIDNNPCAKAEKPRLPQHMPRTLTLDQCRAALAWTARKRPRFLAWLILTMFAGLRPISEANRLTWDKIDLIRGKIYIDAERTKTHRHRIIRMEQCPPAWKWLKIAQKRHAELGTPAISNRRYMRALRDVLGFKEWPQDILRHTAASFLYAFHEDANKVAFFMGHQATVLLRNYRAVIEKEDAEKWMSI